SFVGNMQSTPIVAQCHRTAARYRSLQRTDHPGSRDTAFNRNPKGLEELSNQRRRVALFECGFGMGVNAMPPLGHLTVKLGDPIDDRHKSYPQIFWLPQPGDGISALSTWLARAKCSCRSARRPYMVIYR